MTKRIAIVQSSYVPWKGYFDLINSVDEFVLYDDAQYTVRDWRNRNRIKTAHGLLWLTIPVAIKGRREQKINETSISNPQWREEHWKTIVHHYARAKHFRQYRDVLDGLYAESSETSLSLVNHRFIVSMCSLLGIATAITWSSDYALAQGKTERLVSICRQANANEYLSGPSARAYLNESLFADAGITVSYIDYSGYPEYDQLHPPFEHSVSIVDLILNAGSVAPQYMKSFGSS